MDDKLKCNFINYNQSKELISLGFNDVCIGTIDQTEYIHIKGTRYPVRAACCYLEESAVLWYQAFKFFRENYKLGYTVSHVNVGAVNESGYNYHIYGKYDSDFAYDIDSEKFNTFEEAQSACLDRLIELAK